MKTKPRLPFACEREAKDLITIAFEKQLLLAKVKRIIEYVTSLTPMHTVTISFSKGRPGNGKMRENAVSTLVLCSAKADLQ